MSAVTSQPTWQMNPVTTIPATASAHAQPRATPARPSIAPADDNASSHECLASATMVAERIRRPTVSLYLATSWLPAIPTAAAAMPQPT